MITWRPKQWTNLTASILHSALLKPMESQKTQLYVGASEFRPKQIVPPEKYCERSTNEAPTCALRKRRRARVSRKSNHPRLRHSILEYHHYSYAAAWQCLHCSPVWSVRQYSRASVCQWRHSGTLPTQSGTFTVTCTSSVKHDWTMNS